ncbi:hypothetical protein ACFSJW_01625 [Flavobacterium artemisiae]|uniref:GLPGLI family protein n=1 Tax=Flavobacterium artemisiae TaxID=2126556 RepID=A0ABW4HI86_9FLAO
MKLITVIMLLSSSLMSAQLSFEDRMAIFFNGQSQKISKENLSEVYDAVYDMTLEFSAVNSTKYETESLKENKIYNKTVLAGAIDQKGLLFFKQNAALTLEKEASKNFIVLKSSIPLYSQEADALNSVSISVKENKLLDKNKNKARINKNHIANFGTFRDYTQVNGAERQQTYKTIEFKNSIENTTGPWSGSVLYEVKILTDYPSIKLSQADFGKSFVLNNKSITLINAVNNLIIIDGITIEDNFDITAINLDKNQNVIKSPSTGKYPVYKDLYDLYNKNPNLTKEQLKKELPLEKLQKLKDNGYYYALINDFPFKNSFILFSRAYGISKDIEVKM